MSDRLVLYNKSQNLFAIFAKDFGQGYSIGNVDELAILVNQSHSYDEMIVGDFDILEDDALNVNTSNKWEYFPKSVNDEYIKAINEINKRNGF